MKLTFHTQSLPTARLVWHCPFISLYTSEDGNVDGAGYREFLLLRLDGENWDSDAHVENVVYIDHTRNFQGWNAWKETNKQGMDCTVSIRIILFSPQAIACGLSALCLYTGFHDH